MTDAALEAYIDKWLAAQPAQRLALVFVDPARRSGHAALAALEHELLEAAYGIAEPQVAAAKLNWWAEELAGAAAGGGRHPLSQALIASDAARRVEPTLWVAPALAALRHLDAPTPADFAAQVEAASELHAALAALETAWWFGAEADPARAARLATLGHLVRAGTGVGEGADAGRLPLPMARLARHGLDRDALRDDSPGRREALRAQLDDLHRAYGQAWALPGPVTGFRGLEARMLRAFAGSARRAAEPLGALRAAHARQTGPRTLWRAWNAARQAAGFAEP